MIALTKKVWRRAASLPADIALSMTNAAPVSAYLEHRRSVAEESYLSSSALSPNEAAVVDGLQRKGVFVTTLENLDVAHVGGCSILESGASLNELLAERAAKLNQRHPATILSQPNDLLANPLIYRWGLNAVLLRIVEAYLRQPVAYDGPIVFYTEANKAEELTRIWHLDREDRRVVKVALYLNDVDDAGGPFQILPQMPQNNGARFKYPMAATAELELSLGMPPNTIEPITCTGKAGTLIFAETGRFYHRGKPPSGRNRTAIFYGYFVRPPRNPFYCERARLSRNQILNLIEGLSPEQRVSALWRDVVPWPIRLIPASIR